MSESLFRRLLRRRPPTVFIGGDADGSVLENIHTSAETFVGGSSRGTVVRNVVHESEPPVHRHQSSEGGPA